MPTSYTTLLGLALPVTGELAGTWGNVVNNEITSLLDSAIAGATSVNVTSADVTLTDTDGAADQSRSAILIATGTPGTTRNIVAPSASKVYAVFNTSDSSIVIKGSATTGVTIPTNVATVVAWNGSDFVRIAGDVTLAGTQTLSNKTIVATKEVKVATVANDINLSSGNYFSHTVTTATTFTVSNIPSSGTAIAFILDITNGGSAVVTWYANLTWVGGETPELTSSGRDVLAFFTYDGGTTWNGFVVGYDMLAA